MRSLFSYSCQPASSVSSGIASVMIGGACVACVGFSAQLYILSPVFFQEEAITTRRAPLSEPSLELSRTGDKGRYFTMAAHIAIAIRRNVNFLTFSLILSLTLACCSWLVTCGSLFTCLE